MSRFVCCVCFVFLSAIGAAQTTDTSQKLLEEMKGVRARLDRLVELLEALERSQRAMVVLQQAQRYDALLRTLEAQRETLTNQERDLAAQAANFQQAVRSIEAADANSAPAPGINTDPNYRNELTERLATVNRMLESTRSRLAGIEGEINAARARVAQANEALKTVIPAK
jgi:chromosome segregation ATPase